MAALSLQSVEPGYAGLDTDSQPSFLPPGYAQVHDNFVVHRDGLMQMRGPLVNHTALTLGSNEMVAGVWTWNNRALIGLVAASASATGEPWTGHYRKVSASANLALAETTMKLVDFDALTVTDVTPGAPAQAAIVGGRGQRLGLYTWGYSYAVDTATNPAVNENGGFLFRRKLLRWDGTSAQPTVRTGAPEGAQDVRVHLNRLFVLGGRDVPSGFSLIEPNSLYWSRDGGPTLNTTADWTDPVSGLVNKIVVDSDNANDFGVALAKIGPDLLILKRRSIHVLYGYSPSTFQLSTVSSDVGCIDHRSVVEYEDGVYFLSEQGYMWYNGQSLENVSGNLRTSLAVAAAATVGDHNGVDGGRAVATKLENDYVLLSIQKQTFSDGTQASGESRWAGMLHTPTGRWSKFSSDATANLTPVHVGSTILQPFIVDGTRVVKCHYITTPEQALEADRGFDKVGGASPTSQEIPSKWYSALIPLSAPSDYSQLHRVIFDYSFVVDGGADGANLGWYITLVDANGVVLLPEYQVPSVGDPSGVVFRRRHIQDVFSETSEVQVRAEWRGSGTPLALVKAEIYGATVEFSPGRQLRTT